MLDISKILILWLLDPPNSGEEYREQEISIVPLSYDPPKVRREDERLND